MALCTRLCPLTVQNLPSNRSSLPDSWPIQWHAACVYTHLDAQQDHLGYTMRLSVPLNRQQLDLLDRTVARGLAADRAALLRLALRELLAPKTPMKGK
jgi:hypothetical protein